MYGEKPIIDVRNISKKFGKKVAVDHISFQVKAGEIFGFLGPNGAGKTTTIRMLTALLIPDGGDIFIDGESIKSRPVQAKFKMGVIPETSNIYTDLTARQNIILSGRFYGLSGKALKDRVDTLLDKFGLYERGNDPAMATGVCTKMMTMLSLAW